MSAILDFLPLIIFIGLITLVFRAFLKRKSNLVVSNPTNTHESSSVPSEVRPWVRYWARMFDIYIFCLLVGIIFVIVAPNSASQKSNDVALGMIILFVWIFVESLLLATFGTTPGKWLFKTKISLNSGARMSYSQALARSIKVWWRGLGIGFPIAALITTIIAYGRLTRNGITSWDNEEGFSVSHETIGIPRILSAIAFFFIFFVVVAMGTNA